MLNLYMDSQMNHRSHISEIPMKHQRPNDLKRPHKYLRDLTYWNIHPKSTKKPHILGHAHTNRSYPEMYTHKKLRDNKFRDTLSNKSETSHPGSHTHMQIEASHIRHTLTNRSGIHILGCSPTTK